MTNTSIQQINQELQIVKLNNDVFRVKGGYIRPIGYAFYHPVRGFLAFACDGGRPYAPIGGRNALKSILDAGGFESFDGLCWLVKGGVAQ